jgi:hypothetical protein
MHIEFTGKLLPRIEAGIEIEKLQQVDDRGLVVPATALGGSHFTQHTADVHALSCKRSWG